jgi:hypothetical protein
MHQPHIFKCSQFVIYNHVTGAIEKFACSLINNAFTNSIYTASNVWMKVNKVLVSMMMETVLA